MIFDSVSNAKKYESVHPWLLPVIEKAAAYSPENYPGGKIALCGDDAFLLLNTYKTHPSSDAVMEAHRAYADVMVMVEGEEKILVKDTACLKNVTKPYSPEAEALLAEADADASEIILTAGHFIVLLPQDAHAPACCTDTPKTVKKIIGKIKL